MPSFPGVDFLDFDSLLSDDEKLARQTARQFADEEILPIIEQHNREGKFPLQLVPKMAALGLFGASLKGYGCAGMSNVEYGLVMQEIERGDSAIRSFVSVQSALVMYPIYAFGSEAQKEKWLPLLQQGKAIGCFGLTEPQFGSNPGGMLTRAVRHGSDYVLNGEKMWITNGSIADVAVVWAKCEDAKVRGFLVEKGTTGFSSQDIHGKYSLRASVTSSLALSECRIPAENLLPGVEGLKGPLFLPESSPLWHRLGSNWRGHGVLSNRPRLCEAAQAIRESPHRLSSASPGKAGLDDYGDYQGPIPDAADRPPERSGPGTSVAHIDGQNEQCIDGARDRA